MQNREEAQRAKDDLNGIMLHDNELRIGWGKAITVPSAPMFVLNPSGTITSNRGATIAPPGALSAPMGSWGGLSGSQPPTASAGRLSMLLCQKMTQATLCMEITKDLRNHLQDFQVEGNWFHDTARLFNTYCSLYLLKADC